ncbi:MAG: N-acetylglucosaminyltransferase [Sediminibacterium sp.]|nr:N-acetylglucosaminyltransferase [Sediminibacterium sp.]
MYLTGLIITIALLFGYCLLIWQYRRWFLQLPAFIAGSHTEPQVFFSVIIPARNEEASIKACVGSVLQQRYPRSLFEVIVINDHSTDQTETILRGMQADYPNLRLINLSDHLQGKQVNAYKKKAIEMAIVQSNGNWIVTTDADCMVTPLWLKTIDAYISEQQPVFVAAPVMFTHDSSFLSVFQLLDFMSLQGITAASVSAGYHTMCNGANIAYQKQAFYEVGQFKGIDQVASGDDMLLMYKIKEKYPGKLGYLFNTEAIVTTAPMPDWKSFINQRIRWASKADQYRDKSIFWVLALVYALNAALLALLVTSPFAEHGFRNWVLLVLAKTIVEMSFMIPVAKFYKCGGTLVWFPLMQPFHILYTVVAGWLGKFGTYQWKGRKVH